MEWVGGRVYCQATQFDSSVRSFVLYLRGKGWGCEAGVWDFCPPLDVAATERDGRRFVYLAEEE